jgi:hypothetical protein
MQLEHSLFLVDKSEGDYRLCDECGSLCNGLTYKCVDGDLSIHRWCFHKTTKLTSWLYALKEEGEEEDEYLEESGYEE